MSKAEISIFRRQEMKKMVFFSLIVTVFIMVPIVNAQLGKTHHPRFYSDFRPVEGGWSEYQITAKGEHPSKMKVAIVGKEGPDYWYETVSETKEGERVITKILVSGNPEDQSNLKRMIVKTGNEPAMEMPLQIMQSYRPQETKTPKKEIKLIDKGMETIKVPAGSFKAHRFQYQAPDGVVDMWIFKDVCPYGLVKSQSKDVEMVLIGYGTGARTEITETPRKFEMPQMPQMFERKQKR